MNTDSVNCNEIMKMFSTIMIIVLLTLCHIVDNKNLEIYNQSNPKTRNNSPKKMGIKMFNNSEYKKDVIHYFHADSIYYSNKTRKYYRSLN